MMTDLRFRLQPIIDQYGMAENDRKKRAMAEAGRKECDKCGLRAKGTGGVTDDGYWFCDVCFKEYEESRAAYSERSGSENS